MRRTGRGLAMALVLAAALLTAVGPVCAADTTMSIRVSTVLASKGERGFDPLLHDMRSQLKHLPFKSYRLIDVQSRTVHAGDEYGVQLPGGGYLHIMTTDNAPDHLKLRVLVNESNRPYLNSDLTMKRDSKILLAGPKVGQGRILIHIQVQGGHRDIVPGGHSNIVPGGHGNTVQGGHSDIVPADTH